MHRATIAYVEIAAKDGEALKRFYGSLFGWRISKQSSAAFRLAGW